jgi:superkiller protein 3
MDTNVRKLASFVNVLGLSSILLGSQAMAQAPVTNGVGTIVPQKDILTGQIKQNMFTADKLLAQGKYSDAEDLFRQMLVNNPQDVAATVGLGMALAKQFKLDGADEMFNRVLSADPNNALAHAGNAIVQMNRLQSSSGTIRSQRDSILQFAESEARRACQLAPADAECHYALGLVLKEQGKMDDAASELRTATNLDPGHSSALAALGKIKLDQGSVAEASEYFRKAIDLNSGNSSAHYGLGVSYLKQGMVDDAIKELNIALYQFPNSAPVRLAMGEAYQKQGNEAAALKEYEQSILIKPETPDPYLHIAEIRESRGDLELALAELRSGLAQLPYNLDLRMEIADMLVKLEKADDAIKSYQTIMTMSPNNTQAVKGLSQALYIKAQKAAAGAMLASNDYESALKSLGDAIKLNPNDMELRLAQAKLMSLAGTKLDLAQVGQPQNDGERIAYAEALTAQGDFEKSSQVVADVVSRLADARQALAVADLVTMIDDLDNAQAAYQKAQALGGNADRIARGTAQIAKLRQHALDDVKVADELNKKKQFDGAAERYRDAIATNPRLAEAHLGLARTLEKMPKPTQAILSDAAQHYRLYVALKTDLSIKEKQKITIQADKLSDRANKLAQKHTGHS